VSELEAKYLLFLLFGIGGLAVWSGSEAVLPAYIIGMVLAGTVGKDHVLIRRLRTLTFGLPTPFYFIRAGSFVYFYPAEDFKTLSYSDFATKRVHPAFKVTGGSFYGIPASPDGRYILYSLMDQGRSNIMLVDGFR